MKEYRIEAMPVAAPSGFSGESEVQRLRTLYQLLAALSRAKALDDVYEAAITSLLAATMADRAAILTFDDDGVIRFKAWRTLSAEYRQAVTGHTPWPLGTRDAQPLVVPDVLADKSLAAYREFFVRENIRAVAFIPLTLEAGVFGKFMLYYDQPHSCTLEELEIGQAIAAHVALATVQKRAELASTASEQRLQAILDNSATVIFIKDREGRYQLVNRCFEELFHVSKTQVVGRKDHDLFPPEMAERFRENDRKVLAARETLTFEEEAPHDDGIHNYISIKFPLEGTDGELAGVCGISTDITDRKRLETANLHFAAIVESSDDAIVAKDLNGIITSWNRGAERLFGYTAAEAVGKPVSMLAPLDSRNEMPEILARIRSGHRVEHYETRRCRKDGVIIDVSLTVSPIRNASGRIIGASKIARDITERKRAEQERGVLLAREQEARQTAELLNRVSPRLAAQLDVQKLVEVVTEIATTLAGAEFGSFLHKNEQSESWVPAEVSAGFPMPRNCDLFARTFEGEGVVRHADLMQDPQYGRLVEGSRPVRSYLAVPVVSRSGEVLGGLFFGHPDAGKFTEHHEAILIGIASQTAIALDNARLFEQAQWVQTELKRSNEELRRANQDLETFAYSASHDLQEPLRTIAISAQLLERSGGQHLQGEDARFLASILGSATRMTALIQDLLDYVKATKYAEGHPPSVDATVVLTGALQNLKGAIEEAGAKVTSAPLPIICIHPGRLAQVFQNLISNAIKYRGTGVPHVHISAEERDGWSVFSVVDNGIGIDAKFADQIFGLFKRLHSRQEYPGSGIGLAICQRIIEQYGGRIWLDKSVPGGGSTFCFSIPSEAR